MADRKSLGQKVRFEVFKRDKFTCQYCGKKAPDVVLQCDHIVPVAEGGDSELINLITACAGCNGGKGARLLADTSVVERQRLQIEELEERRQQLEMLLKWRDSLASLSEDQVTQIADYIATKSCFAPNDSGRRIIKGWVKKYPLEELLAAIDEAFDYYLKYDDKGEATSESWNIALDKVPGVIRGKRRDKTQPELRQIFYIRGILRNRLSYLNERLAVQVLQNFHAVAGNLDWAQEFAKDVRSWSQFYNTILEAIAEIEKDAKASKTTVGDN